MKIKSGIKKTLSFISGGAVFKRQVNYVVNDLSEFSHGIKLLKKILRHKKGKLDNWNEVILKHSITASTIESQYKKRRILAGLLLFMILGNTVIIAFRGLAMVGLASMLILVSIYLKNVFRLYQIRERNLCSLSVYLKSITKSFRELLPLSLPANWILINKDEVDC